MTRANFIACHQFGFLEKYEMVEQAVPGATVLLNAHLPPTEVWEALPREVQSQILEKQLKLHVIDAYKVARDTGMGVRINTIMQTCFFAVSGVLPREEAITHIKKTIEKTYARKGREVVQKNFAAVDHTLAHLYQVDSPGGPRPAPRGHRWSPRSPRTSSSASPPSCWRGRATPYRSLPSRWTAPGRPGPAVGRSGPSRWRYRSGRQRFCIQCNKCAIVCPHAAIRPKYYPAELATKAPAGFLAMDYRSAEVKGNKYSLQVAPDDCTGCGLCVEMCPAESKTEKGKRAINMQEALPLKERERKNFDFFLSIPDADRTQVKLDVKGTQFLQPLFEFSGACTGCGETPYIKLLTQLYGDRALIANATGCSSIYGGNLPTTPYAQDANGRGPAWSNSLFEDNAEFGLGMRLALDKQNEQARELLKKAGTSLGDELVRELLGCRSVRRVRHRKAAGSGRFAEGEACQGHCARVALAAPARRLAGEEVGLDRGR